jgi:hypothetical protein
VEFEYVDDHRSGKFVVELNGKFVVEEVRGYKSSI